MFSLPFPALPFRKEGFLSPGDDRSGLFSIGKEASIPSQRRIHGGKDEEIKVLF